MQKYTLILGAGLVLALGVLSYSLFHAGETVNTSAEPEWQSYENTNDGFRISFLTSIGLVKNSDTEITLWDNEAVVVVKTMVLDGAPGKTFEEVVGEKLTSLCVTLCTTVAQVEPIMSDSGVPGHLFYLTGGTGIQEKKGPFAVFVLGTSAAASKVVVIYPAGGMQTPLTQSLVRQTASTFELSGQEASVSTKNS